MQELTNPAKKLHRILYDVAKHGDMLPMMEIDPPDDLPTIWTDALRIDQTAFADSMTDVLHIVDSISRFLQQNDVRNNQKHSERVAKVRRLLFTFGSIRWTEFREEFTDDFIELLGWIDSDISDLWYEAPLSDEELESLQSDIEDLIHDVAASELGDEIKCVITDGLNAVRNAILQYRIRGLEGIRQALAANIDLLIRYQQEFEQVKQHDPDRIWSRWSAVFLRLDGLVSTGFKIKQLAQPVIDRLMLNGGG